MFMTNPQVPYSSILTCELMLGFGTAAPIKVQACPLQHQQKRAGNQAGSDCRVFKTDPNFPL